jgi:Glu-tRNA(Gln) amidotransferase subunit E-like FAD-binding protein
MSSGLSERSSKRATIADVASAPPPISLRLGREGMRALEELARIRRIGKAEAARQAILETARRERARRGLAAETRRLMADPNYLDEAREVSALMEELRGPG